MADKKITELQLRSNVNDDVNFPVDDSIQTYRVTAPQVRDYIYSKQNSTRDALNYSIAAGVAANALTISLKNFAGADPSSTSPVSIAFRSATLTSGLPFVRQLATALSTVISSGSTAGHGNGIDSYLYIYALDHSGTIELAWSSSRVWDEAILQSTTAEGGAGAADSADVLYSTTARTSVPIRYLGRILSNQATAGTWVSAPLEISSLPIYQLQKLYFNGFMDAVGGGWTTSSTVWADPSGGTNTLTTRENVGCTVTAAGSNVPGIVFTPRSTNAAYWVSATFAVTFQSTNAAYSRLTDGTKEVKTGLVFNIANATGALSQTLDGIYIPRTTSPITLKIQMATSSGASYAGIVNGTSGLTNAIEWQIHELP